MDDYDPHNPVDIIGRAQAAYRILGLNFLGLGYPTASQLMDMNGAMHEDPNVDGVSSGVLELERCESCGTIEVYFKVYLGDLPAPEQETYV